MLIKCQRCGSEIPKEARKHYKVLNWEGEEEWCDECIEQHTYYCEHCDQYCADTMPPVDECGGMLKCPFCQDDDTDI